MTFRIRPNPMGKIILIILLFSGLTHFVSAGKKLSGISGSDLRPQIENPAFPIPGFSPPGSAISPHDFVMPELNKQKVTGWQALGPEGGYINMLAIDPKNSQNIYLIAEASPPILFKSTNRGESWQQVCVFSDYLRHISIDPNNPSIIYGVSTRYFHKSENSGVDWQRFEVTNLNCYFLEFQVAPSNTKIIYLFGYQYEGDEYKITIFKSENGGSSFRQIYLSARMRSFNIYSTAVDPVDPKYVYYSCMHSYALEYTYELFRSSDGGNNWKSISAGINNMVESIVIDPVKPKNIYVGTSSNVFRSDNRGDSWKINSGWINCYSLAIDPKNTQTIYAGYYGSIYKSNNGGNNWTKYTSNLENICQDLVVDPLQPQNLYYASVTGMFKSTNGGVDWNANNTGLLATTITSISPAPSKPDLVYVEVQNDAVFKTEDLGTTWKRLTIFSSCGSIGAMAVHPTNYQTVYALEGSG